MERTILHVDANSFFASVECSLNPAIANKPVAVVGDSEKRKGIILTANYIAKLGYGIRTGEAIWQAEQKCPELIKVKTNMNMYLHYSRLMREILRDYSDYIEPFGCDENWVELKGLLRGAGMEIAEKIRSRMKSELGITVSIGVSFNKVFAKLGSDMKKPDAVTEITLENFKDKVWGLNVEALLYVGRKTKAKLNKRSIYTIGDLANTDKKLLCSWLGVNGAMLWDFANGRDTSPVMPYGDFRVIKSIGNSTTCPRDLKNNTEVKTVLMIIAESVAERMRDHHVKGKEISVAVRDNELNWRTHQCRVERPTNISGEIYEYAFALFKESYEWKRPIRSIGICVGKLCSESCVEQLDLLGIADKRIKLEAIDKAADSLKRRFGRKVIGRARLLGDIQLSGVDPKMDHKLTPAGYMAR